MSDKIGVCLIGAGIMGKKHARIYHEMVNAELRAVVDIDREKAAEIARQYGNGRAYVSLSDALSEGEIDAVHVATPDFLHMEPVLTAINAGKHVLVEKPLATSVSDAQKIAETAAGTGVHVMVNYTHRFAAPYAKAESIIRSGEIGEVKMVYARKNDTIWAATEMMNWTHKTSPAAYLSTHDIDLVLWMGRLSIDSVYALSTRGVLTGQGIDSEDAVQAVVRFSNGAIGTFESCWVLPKTMPTVTDSFIEIIGTDGSIHIDRIHEGVKIANRDGYHFPKLSLEYEADGRVHGGIQSCLTHFVDSLRTGTTPQPDASWGVQVVRVSKAIDRSISDGIPVRPDSM